MQDKQKKTEEIFHLKNRKPIIIVIEKKQPCDKQATSRIIFVLSY
jgi:hypothetical protein